MEKIVYSEEEAIMFCINNNVRNSQKRLESFLKIGKLKPGNPTNSLIKDLLLFYNKVELGLDENGQTLLGLNRTYECEGLRSEPLEKKTKHKGTVVSEEETEILMEYVFNQLLLEGERKAHTYKTWANVLNVYDAYQIDNKAISQMFQDYYSINESKKVANGLIRRFDDYRELITNGSFNMLVKANRITKETVYFTKANGKAIEVDEETFMTIENRTRQLATDNGITYKQYVGYSRNKSNSIKGIKKIINAIQKAITDEFNVKSIFRGYRIKVINRKKHLNVSKEMMEEAFFGKLVGLTERSLTKRQKDIEENKHVATGYVEKEFAAFNMFLLIHQYLGEMDLEQILLELLPSKDQIEAVQEIHRQHGIEKANREAERIRNSETFLIEDE